MKLSEWIKRNGGTQEKAAPILGVTFQTINRWLKGNRKPKGLSVRRLKELGIEL